jgi:hypothetical protein
MSFDETPPEGRLTDEQRARLRTGLTAATEERRTSSRPWLVPVAAAAAVGVLVAGAAAVGLATRGGDDGGTPAAGGESSTTPTVDPEPTTVPTATPSVEPTPLRSACDDEVLNYLPGAERAGELGYPTGRTLLYATAKQWIVCDDWATVDGGPPTVLAPHVFSPELGKELLLISQNYSMKAADGAQFFAAGARIPGVQTISYVFPDGHVQDATMTDAMWSMVYLLADPPERIWTDPVVVKVLMDDGSTQRFELTEMDLCAQVNHGC